MPGNDDETRTSSEVTSDPALEATELADPTLPVTGPPVTPSEAIEDITAIGRYRVTEVLGSGGMGVVYRARDPELDRELAIKVVRPQSGTSRAQERLLEEARAMAKLRHPAVVPVFDVGATARGVFIVMPLVAGGTLYDWMKDARPWREVVERFAAAGRGLAAAHAAGLVHRDFKPRNVLLGEGGQVMVADFGIAARTDDSIDPEKASSTPGTAQVSSIAGTPAYMAPEQAEGGPIDARADQYSFCVSMWEALCGGRPHQAETRTQSGVPLVEAAALRKRTNAPAWLLDAVERGFAASPERRWPSMTALIEHIERRMQRPKRIAAVAAVVAIAATVAGVAVLAPGRGDDPCPDPRGRLATVWTADIRGEVERAFRATGLPFAEDALVRIVPVIDVYAEGWRTKAIAVCRAGRVERTQSEALMARRTSCLDRRLAALGAQTTAFRGGGAAIVEGAVASALALPSLDDCDNTEALLAFTAPVAATAKQPIDAMERELDEVAALGVRGDVKEQATRAEAAVAKARTLAYPPVLARALELHASALRRSGQASEAIWRELIQTAAEAHDDAAVVRAWIGLLDDLVVRQGKVAEAKALVPVAEAALIRAGSTSTVGFQLASIEVALATRAGDMDAVLAHARDALGAATSAAERAELDETVARALAAHDRRAEALAHAENALRASEDAFGASHPTAVRVRQLVAELRAPSTP